MNKIKNVEEMAMKLKSLEEQLKEISAGKEVKSQVSTNGGANGNMLGRKKKQLTDKDLDKKD